jgi:hypothetical protein
MKKTFLIYVIGKFCNPCYIKIAKNKNEALQFFQKQGFKVKSIWEA